MKSKTQIEFFSPLYTSSVKAGFPSPAEDFIDTRLDLNTFLIDHPTSTFFVRVSGESMINAGINDGDILIIDKSKTAKNCDIILAVIDGEFTVKRLIQKANQIILQPENEKFKPIIIQKEMNFEVWGVLVGLVRKL